METFVLLIENRGGWESLSPERQGEIYHKYLSWTKELRESGRLVGAEALAEGGRLLEMADGVVTDGPFAETKEMIGGFYAYLAKDLEEAIEIAKGCPALESGEAVSVFPTINYSASS